MAESLSIKLRIPAFLLRLEHPNKLLHTIFEKLYDNDIISEEGFQVSSNLKDVGLILDLEKLQTPSFAVLGEERRPCRAGGQGRGHQVVHAVLHVAQGGERLLVGEYPNRGL